MLLAVLLEQYTILDDRKVEVKDMCEAWDGAMQMYYEEAYEEAYEGFMKAISEESYPIAGMDQATLDYLIANMAFELGHIEVASRMISGILGSRTASAKVKDRAYDMKQQIIAQIKATKR